MNTALSIFSLVLAIASVLASWMAYSAVMAS